MYVDTGWAALVQKSNIWKDPEYKTFWTLMRCHRRKIPWLTSCDGLNHNARQPECCLISQTTDTRQLKTPDSFLSGLSSPQYSFAACKHSKFWKSSKSRTLLVQASLLTTTHPLFNGSASHLSVCLICLSDLALSVPLFCIRVVSPRSF